MEIKCSGKGFASMTATQKTGRSFTGICISGSSCTLLVKGNYICHEVTSLRILLREKRQNGVGRSEKKFMTRHHIKRILNCMIGIEDAWP
jgi:hypothetical protein